MKLAQFQKDALLVLRTRLDPSSPFNTAGDEVKAHLRAIRPWLDCWVLTAVDAIDSSASHDDQQLRNTVTAYARHIRIAQKKLSGGVGA